MARHSTERKIGIKETNATEANSSLIVGESVLRRWVGQAQEVRGGTTAKNNALTTEQRRIQELEKQVKQLGFV